MVFFAVNKVFTFMRPRLLIVVISGCDNHVLFGKSLPVPLNSKLFPTYFPVSFIQLIWLYVEIFDPFGVKFLAEFWDLLELIYMQLSILTSNVGWECFFPVCIFAFLIKNRDFIVYEFILGALVWAHRSTCLFFAKEVVFLILLRCNEVWGGGCGNFSSSFTIQNCFRYPYIFHVSIWSWKLFFKICEELCCHFDGDCTESVACFWYNWPFLLCWFYGSMSIGDPSVIWYLLYFLSSLC